MTIILSIIQLRSIQVLRSWTLSCIVVYVVMIQCCATIKNTTEDSKTGKNPPTLLFIPEMDSFIELESWQDYISDNDTSYHEVNLRAEWTKQKFILQDMLKASMVRYLSQWAQNEMLDYKKLPALNTPTFEVIKQNGRSFLCESTIDLLPSHSPIVKRYLKIYVVFDQSIQAITKIIVTIRGQRFE